MKYRKFYLFIFLVVFVCVCAAMAWNCYRAYASEQKKIGEEVNVMAIGIANDIQAQNITLLNNSARMLTDKEIHEKIAFAAGVTRNEGKLSVTFGEEDDDALPDKTQNSPLNINKEFIIQHNLRFDAGKVKGIPVFDSMMKVSLEKKGWNISYVTDTVVRHDSLLAGSFYSEPFIFDFFEPVMYRIKFEVPASAVFKRILPEIIAGIGIVLLLVGAFIFFYRSYRIQLQMSSFRESLFSNVTHELKSPLTSLRLIIDEANELQPLSAEHKVYAQKELNRMSLLIEKILSFGKMSREQVEMNKVLVDAGAIVDDAIEVQAMMIKRLGGQVKTEIPEKGEVYADKALLTNVFITLLDNALKYNKGTPRIDIQISRHEKDVVISVADNGIGIDAAFHRRIFDPFFRIPDNDRHNVKGHGLGLSFVKQVIEMHGGDVSVESSQDNGATFFIKLPKA